MILILLEALCFIIPGTVFLIEAMKSKKKLLLTPDSVSIIYPMLVFFFILREQVFSNYISEYLKFFVVIIAFVFVITLINKRLFGYNQTIYSEDIDGFKKIIIEILNKENILFSIKEDEEDQKIIFKFNEFIFKRITIRMRIGRKDDKIKYFILYFQNINRKKALYFMKDIVGYFDEKQIFKDNKSMIILYSIFAIIEYGIAVLILLKKI